MFNINKIKYRNILQCSALYYNVLDFCKNNLKWDNLSTITIDLLQHSITNEHHEFNLLNTYKQKINDLCKNNKNVFSVYITKCDLLILVVGHTFKLESEIECDAKQSIFFGKKINILEENLQILNNTVT